MALLYSAKVPHPVILALKVPRLVNLAIKVPHPGHKALRLAILAIRVLHPAILAIRVLHLAILLSRALLPAIQPTKYLPKTPHLELLAVGILPHNCRENSLPRMRLLQILLVIVYLPRPPASCQDLRCASGPPPKADSWA